MIFTIKDVPATTKIQAALERSHGPTKGEDAASYLARRVGMKPEMRAQKVLDSAQLTIEGDLAHAPLAKKTLMHFPALHT